MPNNEEQLNFDLNQPERPTAEKIAADALEKILEETKGNNILGIGKKRVSEIIFEVIEKNVLNPNE